MPFSLLYPSSPSKKKEKRKREEGEERVRSYSQAEIFGCLRFPFLEGKRERKRKGEGEEGRARVWAARFFFNGVVLRYCRKEKKKKKREGKRGGAPAVENVVSLSVSQQRAAFLADRGRREKGGKKEKKGSPE